MQADSLNTILVKRLRGPHKPIYRHLLFLFFVLSELLAVWFIIHPFTKDFLLQLLIPWGWALNTPLLIWTLCGIILPGQGDLTLTSKGFEVKNVDPSYRRKYRWSEVTGFYQESTSRYNIPGEPIVCFDVVGCSTKKRKKIFNFSYEVDRPALVLLLNEWKEKYGPNPEGVIFDPIPEPPKQISRPIQKIILIVLGIPLVVCFLLGIVGGVVMGIFEFNSTSIRIVNKTGEALKNFYVVAYPSDTKKALSHYIDALKPNEATNVQLWHFTDGDIRLVSKKHQPYCHYVSHTQCHWRDGDSIFLKPHGKIEAHGTLCRSEKTKMIDEMVIMPCAKKDDWIRKQKFHYDATRGAAIHASKK